jgi:predicted secreted protein
MASTPGAKPTAARKPRVPRTALTDAQFGAVIFTVYAFGLVVGSLTTMAGWPPIAQLVIFAANAAGARFVIARLTRRLRRTR